VLTFLEHEELLARGSASELKKLFALAAAGRIAGLPVRSHSEPFLQLSSDTVPLPYNPLPRHSSRAVQPELVTPFFD
jgi:hypothetical protein